jgi:DNA-binding CsgD family transcriptional regulator
VLVGETAHWALTLLELSLGRAGEALERARENSSMLAVVGAGLDRLEAAVRTGELETAPAWLAALGRKHGPSGRGPSCEQAARRRKRVLSARDQLTPQELQIAHFVAQGLSNREVAAQLFLSPRTTVSHLRSIFRRSDILARQPVARATRSLTA